jgi:hypothetical protein
MHFGGPVVPDEEDGRKGVVQRSMVTHHLTPQMPKVFGRVETDISGMVLTTSWETS